MWAGHGRGCFYNVHYVNIAWGFIFWSCLFVCRVGTALWILLFTLKINLISKSKIQCAVWATATKSMTKNKTEGAGMRKGKKDRGNFAKYRLIILKSILQSGWIFCPVGVAYGSYFIGWNNSSCLVRSVKSCFLYCSVLRMLLWPAMYWTCLILSVFSQFMITLARICRLPVMSGWSFLACRRILQIISLCFLAVNR